MTQEFDEQQITHILEERGYVRMDLIGSGGYSRCYKIYSQKYTSMFACKIIYVNEAEANVAKKSSYTKEVNALLHLSHPNIIEFYDYFTIDHYVFIILEYCPGGDLLRYVREHGPLPEEKLIPYAKMAAQAISFMHENNFVHLDIKPSNFFIDKNGRLKLADFGLAQEVPDPKTIAFYLGSPAFLSPEIIRKRPYNPFFSDMWAFGVTLFFLSTGQLPFPTDNIQVLTQVILCCTYQIPPWVNKEIKAVIHGTLVDSPTARLTAMAVTQMLAKAETLLPANQPNSQSRTLQFNVGSIQRRRHPTQICPNGSQVFTRSPIAQARMSPHRMLVRPKSLPANHFIDYLKNADAMNIRSSQIFQDSN